jgi:hypothetical protein
MTGQHGEGRLIIDFKRALLSSSCFGPMLICWDTALIGTLSQTHGDATGRH